MNVSELLITEYELHVFYESEYERDVVTLRRTSKNPERWAIYHNPFVLNKKNGRFCYDPLPSSREDNYFKTYRFDTAEEAIQYWEKLYASQFFPSEQKHFFFLIKGSLDKTYGVVFHDNKSSELWVETPFEFGDGDHFVIRIKKDKSDPKTLIIDDNGHTYMHLSIWYSDDQIMEVMNSKEFGDILKKNGVIFTNKSGQFKKLATGDTFIEAIKKYTYVIDSLVNHLRECGKNG